MISAPYNQAQDRTESLTTRAKPVSQSLPIHIYLGGSFDPVHNSHLAVITHVYKSLKISTSTSTPTTTATQPPTAAMLQSHHNPTKADITAYFLPTSRSPLKLNSSLPKHRLNMLTLATDSIITINNTLSSDKKTASTTHNNNTIKSDSDINLAKNRINLAELNFSICELEIWQTPPTYTIDTLRTLRMQNPNISLVFIVGADNIASLPQWREAENLTQFAHLWVIPRDELQGQQDIVALLPDLLKTQVVTNTNPLQHHTNGYIYIDNYSVPPFSSSEIREAIAAGKLDIAKTALPASVYSYIIKHNLYKSSELF